VYVRIWLIGQSAAEEAVMAVGVSRHDRLAVIRRIARKPLSLGPPEWLSRNALDDSYFRLLPSSSVMAEEAAMLTAVFGKDGEMPARPLGGPLGGSYGSRRPS
jgi:hypothetical protein